MTPNQPYLLRAYYEWIVDNDLTPHLAVDAEVEGVEVPREHVKDGQIVLNVSPTACVDMQMGNEWIMFNARFSGVSRRLVIPCKAVLAIFARENGAGTIFMQQDGQSAEQGEMEAEAVAQEKSPVSQGLKSVDGREEVESEGNHSAEPPKPPKGRPSLKVVK
ncbi:ClpXP protease specificity-enhancing factor [Paraneptunicella aestuarii]|uniref:ClpXP protease specificity-enhancing factor n=1 Tax=Paraneptunicella aestuarii TaxID=2831148 RepID=UPI001E28DDFE|nr:ClpXP protease specificity-enhancing factor [Paraneptunicella aestuarii]UAA38428.1 ClpXP protease specificity-enhancing factor [Paraneptunicella aestuarii]